MKIAFLIGSDSAATRLSIDAACQTPGVDCVGVLLDVAQVPFSRRMRNLRRHLRREGASFALYRLLQALSDSLDQIARRLIPAPDVTALLRRAFPDRSYTVWDIADRYGFPVLEVANLNSPEAATRLRNTGAQLGVVLGTRVLKPSTFAVPPLGCINLHKGKVPEYRGVPPGFWELYEGVAAAGVTVHFVDARLDTGDIVATSELRIHRNETLSSLQAKLHLEGARVLTRALAAIATGNVQRIPQGDSHIRPRRDPTRKERLRLQQRRPERTPDVGYLKQIAKSLSYLGFYYLGLYGLLRFMRSRMGSSHGTVLLYHRVNDYSSDPLTASTAAFAEHLLLLRKHYSVQPSGYLIDRLSKGERIPPNTVIIHFDDCYKDVYVNAAPLLQAAGLTATAFIATGYVGSERSFPHDGARYAFSFPNLSTGDVRGLVEKGFEVGAHTVSHADLGRIGAAEAEAEVRGSRRELAELSGAEVVLFSFPFGRRSNINPAVVEIVRRAGFKALFSAHGGSVGSGTSLFDIPRIGASSDQRALDLMMEIEGLSMGELSGRLMPWRRRDRGGGGETARPGG